MNKIYFFNKIFLNIFKIKYLFILINKIYFFRKCKNGCLVEENSICCSLTEWTHWGDCLCNGTQSRYQINTCDNTTNKESRECLSSCILNCTDSETNDIYLGGSIIKETDCLTRSLKQFP